MTYTEFDSLRRKLLTRQKALTRAIKHATNPKYTVLSEHGVKLLLAESNHTDNQLKELVTAYEESQRSNARNRITGRC